MSEREWTEGPWAVRVTKHGPDGQKWGLAVFAPARLENDEPGKYPDDDGICGIWGVMSSTDEANARLIAASPELFEMLKALTLDLPAILEGCALYDEEGLIPQAIALVERVEGRKP